MKVVSSPLRSMTCCLSFFNTTQNTWHLISKSPRNTNWRHHISLSLGTGKHSPSHYSMLRKHDIVDAASLLWVDSTARVIEWVPKKTSRGIKHVLVDMSTVESQPRPRKKARRRCRAENKDTLQGETPSWHMDVDETFWVDEPAMPSSEKKVR